MQRLHRNHSLRQTSHHRTAFTLMELLLVLVLLVTVSAVAMPAIGRWQQAMPLEQATTRVRNELTHTRLLAIDEAASWSVEIQSGGQSFQRYRTQSKNDKTVFELPAGVHFVAATSPLHFQSDGTISDTVLVLEDSQGIQQHLKLDRLTGTIRRLN